MKNIIKIGLVALGLVTVLNAEDKGLLNKVVENLNPIQYIKNFLIEDGTKFKIADNEKAVITGGTVKCFENSDYFFIDNDINKMCTTFENKDNVKFKVVLLGKSDNGANYNVFTEEWTLKKTNESIQILRPNGFPVQLDNQNYFTKAKL